MITYACAKALELTGVDHHVEMLEGKQMRTHINAGSVPLRHKAKVFCKSRTELDASEGSVIHDTRFEFVGVANIESNDACIA